MNTPVSYNKFPLWIVILSNALSVSIYGIGFFLMVQFGWVIAILYLAYILILEYRLIRTHCINCYYWGKICGFGKGKVSSWFFKKGDTANFCSGKMTWKDIIPDMLVSLIPLVVGIVLLVVQFKLSILLLLILFLVLSFTGNGFVRENLTCKYCKQRELGCPADKLFNKGEVESR